MIETFKPRKPVASVDVRSFFEDSLVDAMHHQQVTASESTVCYVAGLLTRFSRTERLVEKTESGKQMPVLALLYARAQESADSIERNLTMQRLGDVALFLSGVFSESFTRKLVDVDYFIGMGAGAYGYLAEPSNARIQQKSDADVFAELAEKFSRFVDVLNEICERSAGRSNRDLMRVYDVWLRTQSPRAAQQLRALGIHIPDCPTKHAH